METFKKSIKTKFPFLIPIIKCVRAFIKSIYRLVQLIILPVKIRFNLPEKRPHKLIRFEVHLTDHCNLNCASCTHFSPLAEPSFVNIDTFRRDFIRMGKLFSHKCEWIHLLGGEPLLNPDVIELMKIARENFSDGDIQIVTNGILLPQQDEKFWRACHDNNIQVRMTLYPIKIDIDKIKKLAEDFDVDFNYYGPKTGRNEFTKMPLDLSGKGSAIMNFFMCWLGNRCMILREGKLFTCTTMPHVFLFNKAFNQNIPVTEADYIDIYSDITPKEILRRLAKHIPACSYCNIRKHKAKASRIKWQLSKRKISEWV